MYITIILIFTCMATPYVISFDAETTEWKYVLLRTYTYLCVLIRTYMDWSIIKPIIDHSK